ncbi:hypothetical protein PCL_12183 [Purpureocillium lilacinum]|uniref:Uncharacterized protein n=1 Tax=Purpureocillium lilacinum TaxID=33203 RepID=A0A2U3E8H6_PURLI|nr:hypothetical protein PCL_12183 [Purpureocillium lilacinum]
MPSSRGGARCPQERKDEYADRSKDLCCARHVDVPRVEWKRGGMCIHHRPVQPRPVPDENLAVQCTESGPKEATAMLVPIGSSCFGLVPSIVLDSPSSRRPFPPCGVGSPQHPSPDSQATASGCQRSNTTSRPDDAQPGSTVGLAMSNTLLFLSLTLLVALSRLTRAPLTASEYGMFGTPCLQTRLDRWPTTTDTHRIDLNKSTAPWRQHTRPWRPCDSDKLTRHVIKRLKGQALVA